MGLIIALLLQYGWTALHYAADSGCVDVLQVLVMEKECDVAMTTKVNNNNRLAVIVYTMLFTVRTNSIPFCCKERSLIMPQAIVCGC